MLPPKSKAHRLSSKLASVACFLFLLGSCATIPEPHAGEIGSVHNPVRADMPEGERIYLKRLRTVKGNRVIYNYSGAIMGPEGRILDRFILFPHPKRESCEGFLLLFADLFRSEPDCPTRMIIYMDMYHPGYQEKEPVSGYETLQP